MQKTVTIPFVATYETLGEYSDKTEAIWLVFHGYGQLAKHFIRRFDILDPEKNYVIAPQGLSKFYTKSYTTAGASWLTKEDRDLDLINQLVYVQAVFEATTQKVDWSKVKLNLMAFSQGAATVSRWAAKFKIPFDQMILWGGTLAHELTSDDFAYAKPNATLWAVIGKEDEFYDEHTFEKYVREAEKIFKKPPCVVIFEGKHEVKREVLATVIEAELLADESPIKY